MPPELVAEHIIRSIITGIVFLGLAFSPVGRAIAHRITNGRGSAVPADDPRVDDLMEDNQQLRRQIEEIHERLEFTERMLAQARERGQLGGTRT